MYCYHGCIVPFIFTYPVVTGGNIEDGLESQPDYARGVHGEADKLGLIEVLWALSSLKGVKGTKDDEDAVVC